MRIPHEAFVYYLGEGYSKMKIPVMLTVLRIKGLDLPGSLTMAELMDRVERYYAKAIRTPK